MLYYTFKVLLSAVLIVAITEIAKRSSQFSALLASVPLTSVLAFVWLYAEGSTSQDLAKLSAEIFWLVIPSLLLFLVFPYLLLRGWNFWLSLACGMLATAIAYWLTLHFLNAFKS